MEYEYCLYTWGGFYNEEYWRVHQQESGAHYFDTAEQREDYKKALKRIEEKLGARCLMTEEWEGRDCRIPVSLHRTILVDGYEITTSCDATPIRDYESALYYMENKWYPGCNDEPLGEDFDYSDIDVVKEWITGPFNNPA